jgi:hypothetical protein
MCHSNIERGTFQIARMVLNNTKYLVHKPTIIKTVKPKSTSSQVQMNLFPETVPIIKYTFPTYRLEPIV